jgi:sugar phosphate isomerase/epimerase
MKTCLHTVSYAGGWGQASLSLEETVDRAATLGFDGVMLMARRPHASVLDMPPSRVRELAARLERLGLSCACIAGYTNFTADAARPDIPLREMQVDHVAALCRLAQELGCGVVRVFTGYETPDLAPSRAWGMCVASLRECADRAADLGVTIGVQNHHDIAAGWQAMQEMLAQVDHPHCRACFDAWAPALHGDDVVAAARQMGPLTVHTTTADYVRLPRYRYEPQLVSYVREPDQTQAVPIGEGFVDNSGFLTALSQTGYRGYVGYEMCSPLRGGGGIQNLDRCAQAFLDVVRPLP